MRVDNNLLHDPVLCQQIVNLSQLMHQPQHSNIEYEAALFQIAHSLVRLNGSLEVQTDTSRKDSLLLKAKDFILANLEQDICIDTIAQEANMSKYHFIRQFRSQFGITPHQYVLSCRINQARKALQAGLTSSQAAIDSGFTDSSHLNRRFKLAYGIMYTPGPINLLGLHSGINAKAREHIGFFAGVGMAMLILFVSLSFIGVKLINPQILPYVSLAGCSYILYIAYKVFKANVTVKTEDAQENILSFRDGLFMHLLNPKALIATLPVSTIQFPAAGITGGSIIFWSLILSIFASGAPASYSLVGAIMGKRIENPIYFRMFNILMSALLVYVALSIGYEHVYLAL